MNGNAIADVVTQYMAAWNEPDATTRDALLAQCWSDGGVLCRSECFADRA